MNHPQLIQNLLNHKTYADHSYMLIELFGNVNHHPFLVPLFLSKSRRSQSHAAFSIFSMDAVTVWRHATSSASNNLIGRLQSAFYNTHWCSRWNSERTMTKSRYCIIWMWSKWHGWHRLPKVTVQCNFLCSVVIDFLLSHVYRPQFFIVKNNSKYERAKSMSILHSVAHSYTHLSLL
jgi:hypothetical protein